MGFEDWGDFDFVDAPKSRPAKAAAGYWLTARGEQIAIVDMEHSHLLNTIAYVERQYRQLQDTFCDEGLDIDLLYPPYAGLVTEARRRRLIKPGKKHEMVTS